MADQPNNQPPLSQSTAILIIQRENFLVTLFSPFENMYENTEKFLRTLFNAWALSWLFE